MRQTSTHVRWLVLQPLEAAFASSLRSALWFGRKHLKSMVGFQVLVSDDNEQLLLERLRGALDLLSRSSERHFRCLRRDVQCITLLRAGGSRAVSPFPWVRAGVINLHPLVVWQLDPGALALELAAVSYRIRLAHFGVWDQPALVQRIARGAIRQRLELAAMLPNASHLVTKWESRLEQIDRMLQAEILEPGVARAAP